MGDTIGNSLRERKPHESGEDAANDAESPGSRMKDKKTYGRTPDGTVFTVPETHDMVSQLFSPSQPKNFSDLIVVAVLGLHILTLYLLAPNLRVPSFAVIFLFWRACYNVGIGYLLLLQSNHWRLVAWAKGLRLFVDPKTGNNPQPILYYLLKREMETKIPKDYKFEDAPVEYNTWLVFRRVVDLILMCDFVSYCLFAIACGSRPSAEGVLMTCLRWTTGLSLFGFNIWVKLDAHRVIKDYAWYWGDFFYLIDQELTFDGVFEMAPHPMYSIGYAGYYGISLMAASYRVLAISVIAHAAQFAFLVWVENPHIEKTYNSPPTRQRRVEADGERDHEDNSFVRDSTAMFTHPTRISITRLAPDLAGYDPKDYSVEIKEEVSTHTSNTWRKSVSASSSRERDRPDQPASYKVSTFTYGCPIKVRWTAPLNHSKRDWIGLYMVPDNVSRETTRVSSQGRWVPTNKDQYGSIIADRGVLLSDARVSGAGRRDGENKDYLSGEMEFSGDKVWWSTGVFEFRYHHNGKHNVMAISTPFEIAVHKFDKDDVEADANGSIKGAVEQSLMQIVQNCFDRDPDIAPSDVDEHFGGLVERDGKYARRVVFAIHQMFGIEFAPEVVQADGNIRNLAWRVCNAKKVLEPFMSLSRGKTTPTESRY